MKGLIRASLAALVLVASGSVMAQNAFVGASVGQARHDVDCTGFTCDKNDTGWKLFGGYMFSPNLGAEVHYVDLGKVTASGNVAGFGTVNASLKANGFGISLLGVAPFDRFSIFGKVGVTYLDTEISGSIPGVGAGSDSESNTNINWGVGAAFDFTRNLSARLEWERFRAEYAGEKENVDLISVGVSFRF